VNSKALAQPPHSKAAGGGPLSPRAVSRRSDEPAPSANPAAPRYDGVAAARFLRSLQILVRAVRLYQRNHPQVTESLEAAERDLRAVFQQLAVLSIGVERDALTIAARESAGGQYSLPDPRGELRGLADTLASAGVRSLTFLPRTNLGELALLAAAIEATCRLAGQSRGGRNAAGRDWPAWVSEHRVTGIRVNARIERSDDTVLASLLGALLGLDPATAAAPRASLESTADQVRAALQFLAAAAPRLEQAQQNPTPEAARAVHAELASADPHTQSMLARYAVLEPPREGDTLHSYLDRLSDALVVSHMHQEYLSGRTRPSEVRLLLAQLHAGAERHGGAEEDVQIESRIERFWATLPARETTRVLASPDAWCVPVLVLRRYLERLIAAADTKRAEASGREARRALADFARCIESEESKARRAVAAGLVELSDVTERLWPCPQLADLGRRVVAALARETSPGIAGLLTATVENLARLGLAGNHFAEVERILNELDKAPQDAEHIATLARRIVAQESWLALVDVALDHRPLDPVLPRLLRRDPERLVDRLSLLLTSPEGITALAPMARLVRAAGEPVLGTLESHLTEPRRQRTATAIKFLSAVAPERLAAALPRAFAGWEWALQDLAVSELARRPNAALRMQVSEALLATLTEAHLIVVPGMLDHIALAGDAASIPRLMQIAAGEVDRLRDVFIRIKAVEALGHLRAMEAASLLRDLVRQRSGLTYVEPSGLRSAAEEALALIENRPGSARLRAAKEAVEKSSASFPRPRRYLRVPLSSPLAAVIEGSHAGPVKVHSLSLGGASIETAIPLTVGDSFRIEIHAGLQRIRSTAVVRNITPTNCGIQFVHMKPEDREKLRRRVYKLLN